MDAASASAAPPASGQDAKPGLAARATGAALRFAEGYMEMAQREARRDAQRVFIGVGMVVVGCLLTVVGVIIGQAFLVALLIEFGIKPVYTFGGLLAGDLLLAMFLLITARFVLLRPLLPQTRKVLRDTIELLVGG